MIKFRFISLNSEGFLIQQKGPMVRFINYFSIVENMFSHYTNLVPRAFARFRGSGTGSKGPGKHWSRVSRNIGHFVII